VSELDPEAARDVVRRGYDEISEAYRGDDEPQHRPDGSSRYVGWVAWLQAAVPPRGRILDLGCGNGVPVCRQLASAGYVVTGVDFSAVQIGRAGRLVPSATFLVADMTAVSFAPESFDAVLALYSLIHVPLAEQPALLARVREWLVPGGRGLLITGHRAWTGAEHGWLGGGQMWWSQADAATYRDWLTAAGLRIDVEEFIPEGDSGHALFTVTR
jgi:2-polyprenyl-3-methyl-5-hydroxy-6-metoxy-1,4-benzoquinol methylase